MAVMADTEISAAFSANTTHKEILKYLNWENAGILNAKNFSVASDLNEDDLKCAYDLGEKLK